MKGCYNHVSLYCLSLSFIPLFLLFLAYKLNMEGQYQLTNTLSALIFINFTEDLYPYKELLVIKGFILFVIIFYIYFCFIYGTAPILLSLF